MPLPLLLPAGCDAAAAAAAIAVEHCFAVGH
jgi:hypothetical protein